MAEETAVIDVPPAEDGTGEFDMGNLKSAFDAAFPATATKEEPTPTPAPAPAAAEPAPSPAPTKAEEPPKPVGTDTGLPDDIFEDKPVKPVEAAPKEYDAPESVKKDPKAFANWSELRKAEETARARAAKAEVELASLREKAEKSPTDEGLVARLAEYEAINKELSERISTVDLQAHPEFQRQFVQARERLVSSGIELVKDAGVEPAEFERALSLTGKAQVQALDQIVGNIESPTLQAQIGAVIKDINALDRNRAAALADSKGNLERLAKHAKAQEFERMQQHAKFIDKAIDKMAETMANFKDESGNYKGLAFLRKVDGNEDWNKKVDGYIQRAKDTATNSKDEGQLLSKILMGEVMPDIYDSLLQTRKRVKDLESQLAEFKSADPTLNGSRHEDNATAPADKGLSFAEAAARGSGLR